MKTFAKNQLSVVLVTLSIIAIIITSIGIAAVVDQQKETSGAFDTFSSCNQMENYIINNRMRYDYPVYYDDVDFAREEEADASDSVAPGLGSGEKQVDYSETNVQVAGIDESDVVKTDGEFIYIVWENKVYVVDAATQEVLTDFEVPGSPFQMFLDGDKLVIFSNEDYYYTGVLYDTSYWPLGSSEIGAFVYDVSDKDDINLEREIKLEGYFNTSRKIDDTIYIVSTKSIYDFSEGAQIEEYITQVSDSAVSDEYNSAANCNNIAHFGENVDALITVTAFSIEDDSKLTNKVLLGDASNIYMSNNNLYLATVVYEYEETESVSDPVGKIINPEDYVYREIIGSNTEIYRLEVNNTDVEFGGSGEVPGTLLNQFSMDEHNSYFRVATTSDDWGGWNDDSYNNMYVLDVDNMEIVGKVERLAAGEQIYSVRFIGDRAYMVTFKTIDPLFVLDLSNPEDPDALGELKIPGYSDYLHPYDEDHIIGIGKDAESISEDSAIAKGLKFALFDVSDVNNPVVESEYIVGSRGSSSEALYDHKAFLFDREKGLIVVPVDLYGEPDSGYTWDYGDVEFSGFLALNINLETGISERGRVEYGSFDDRMISSYYYDYNPRALYIEDNLFTFEGGVMKVSDLATITLEKTVELYQEEE